MATYVHGKNAYIEIDNASGTPVVFTSVSNDITYNSAIEAKETAYFGISDKTYIVGQRDATIQISGLFDATLAGTLEAAIDGLLAGTVTGGTLTLKFGPAGNATGKKSYAQEVIPTSYDIGSPVGDVVKMTVNFQRTGATTISTF